MEKSTHNDRLENLEQQVRQILEIIGRHSTANHLKVKDWRRSLGMFDDHPEMKQIDDEGQRIRKLDREQIVNDHS